MRIAQNSLTRASGGGYSTRLPWIFLASLGFAPGLKTFNANVKCNTTAVFCAQVVDAIKYKTDSRQLEKYHQYADEMERVTRLLLLLAGRLARQDNSSLQLPPSGDSQPTTPVFLVHFVVFLTTGW